IFSNYEQAVQYLESREEMPVIKASGLAAGKGVILPETLKEAIDALGQIMKQRLFGAAGET
ncbi:MAG: phosphoribosylamine--glycine ligase, partial [Deltaproteobacteria bacterium CG_4_9_14_3_um_filter_65_9]